MNTSFKRTDVGFIQLKAFQLFWQQIYLGICQHKHSTQRAKSIQIKIHFVCQRYSNSSRSLSHNSRFNIHKSFRRKDIVNQIQGKYSVTQVWKIKNYSQQPVSLQEKTARWLECLQAIYQLYFPLLPSSNHWTHHISSVISPMKNILIYVWPPWVSI